VLHFHYTAWPDFRVPESPTAFLDFLFAIREEQVLSDHESPAVIHCSAGIGRSGTVCLVDSCLVLVSQLFVCLCLSLALFVHLFQGRGPVWAPGL